MSDVVKVTGCRFYSVVTDLWNTSYTKVLFNLKEFPVHSKFWSFNELLFFSILQRISDDNGETFNFYQRD